MHVEFTELRLGTVDEVTESGPELGKAFWTIGMEAFNDETRVNHTRAGIGAGVSERELPR